MEVYTNHRTWRKRLCPNFFSTNEKHLIPNEHRSRAEPLLPSEDLVVLGDPRKVIIVQIRNHQDEIWHVRRKSANRRVLGGLSYMTWSCWLTSSSAATIAYVFGLQDPTDSDKYFFASSNKKGNEVVLSEPMTLPRVFKSSDSRLFKLTVSTPGRNDVLLHLSSNKYAAISRRKRIILTTNEDLGNETSLVFQQTA